MLLSPMSFCSCLLVALPHVVNRDAQVDGFVDQYELPA